MPTATATTAQASQPVAGSRACPCGSGESYARCCGQAWKAVTRRRANPTLDRLDEEGRAARDAGQTALAECRAREVLARDAAHSGALSLLISLRIRSGDRAAVEVLFQRLLALYPRDDRAHCEHAGWLLEQGRFDEARPLAARALEINPRNAHAQALLGHIAQKTATLEQAEYHFRLAHYQEPQNAQYSLRLAHVLRTLGRMDEARRFYRVTLALEAGNLDALQGWIRLEEAVKNLDTAWRLLRHAESIAPDHHGLHICAALLHQRAKDSAAALARLDRVHPEHLARGMQSGYWFDRGRVLDALGRYPEAFVAYTQGNRVAREHEQRRYPAAENADLAARLKRFFTSERMQRLPRGRPVKGDAFPIFIVGFPRSGTSMVEQMLTAHPNICAGDELALTLFMTRRAQGWLKSQAPYPECLAELERPEKRALLQSFRNYYLGEVRTMGVLEPGALRFTDKMPLNETHLGLIKLCFPRAPIIHVLRHPLDVLLSCYFTELRHGDNFAYDLATAAQHYVLVMDLVEHYRRELDLNYRAVRYEDLVTDVEAGARSLLEFVGEPWDERCVAFHESARYARTASYAQVTEKVYTRSVYRFRNYREQLAPILPVIAPVAERLGYSMD